MTDKHSDAASVASSQVQPSSSLATASVHDLDRVVVQALFAAFRTSIPAEVQRSLLRDSLEELKFLVARQPRLSSFHHRRRESLRHPALAMATKNYYQLCRRKRIELAVQAVAAEHFGRQHAKRADSPDGQVDGTDAMAEQRESELVDLLLAEYAQSGGFQDEFVWLNRHGNNNNSNASLGESARFNTSTSFGSRGMGSASAQRIGSASAMEMRNETSLSMVESRTGPGTFFTEVGNTSFAGMSGMWRGSQSIARHSSVSPGNHAALADSIGTTLLGRLDQSFTRGNNSANDGNGGLPRSGRGARIALSGGAGRFFSKRHNRGEDGGMSARGGGRGDGVAWWGAEMHTMVIRRAEEELKAGSGGDAYLLTSSRPIEILLTCYGGVQRDPAAMAMGAASLLMSVGNFSASMGTAIPADADPLFNAVVEEDVRWEQLAQCYRQLLRGANAVCQPAAAAVAHDPLVNDVIRRFWERLTVSAAAQQAHQVQEATKKRDAADAATFSRRVQSRLSAGEADEDDLDEILPTSEDDADADDVAVTGTEAGSRSTTSIGSHLAKDATEAAPRKGAKGRGKGRKKKNAAVTGFAAKAGEPASTVAYYMTPLQYVYLHTRLAHVLLPDCNALDMEMLYFIQEDLLVDAAYNEQDAAQTLYFGEAPRLASPNGTVAGPSRSERRRGGKGRFATLQYDDNSAIDDDDGQRAPSLQQRFVSVRRHGYALGGDGVVSNREDDDISVLVRHPTAVNFGSGTSGDDSSTHRGGNSMRGGSAGASAGDGGGGSESKETAMNALPLVNMCFSISELPSLTYQQFWCSMMELADNWTCCAGHPVETAIFLWELYAEVFGHNWGAEDEVLATALEEKSTTVSKAERTRIDAEVADTLKSFHDLVKALRAHEREDRSVSSSRAGDGLGVSLNKDATVLPGGGAKNRRRRHGSRKGNSQPIAELEETSVWDSSSASSDSDLSPTEWNALAADGHGTSGEWVYVERVGADGVKRRFRRRIVHHQRRRRHDPDQANGPSENDYDEAELSFILEEELDDGGAVVKQRKRRCKAVVMQNKRRRPTKPLGRSSSHTTVTSSSLYEHRRKYDEDNAKQLRRLEVRRRVEPGSSRASSLTSWESYDDVTTEDRRNGRRRRRRVRRTGPRRSRLLDRIDRSDDDSVGLSESGSSAAVPGNSVAAETAEGAGGHDKSAPKSHLTPAELAELQANKDWLCSVLGAKGICLPLHVFDDPAEQVLLYELLRLTKESQARGGAGVGGGGRGEDGLFNFGDDEDSGEKTDLSHLAALLAQSATFNLDGLDDSALMRRLLGEGVRETSRFLSPHQLQSILLALAQGQEAASGGGGPAAETESMRSRRLRLLHILEERRAREQQEQSNAEANDALAQPPSTVGDEAAEVAPVPAHPPTLSSSLPFPRPDSEPSLPALSVHGSDASAAPGHAAHKTPAPPPARASPAESPKSPEDAEWVLSPATAAERREQERLFRELEAYWTDRVSQRGRYRVHLIEYTKEQLDEFFAHLHLGSRQRALLRGRAPLAAATSLVGGTLHEDTSSPTSLKPGGPPERTNGGHRASVSGTASSPAPHVPLAAAPVKLFTLTTEASLDGALRESYLSYLNDRAFSTTTTKDDAVRKTEKVALTALRGPTAPASGRRPLQQSGLPPLSQSDRLGKKSSTVGANQDLAARPSAAVSAAPLPPSSSSKILPALAGSTARRSQPPLSASSTKLTS